MDGFCLALRAAVLQGVLLLYAAVREDIESRCECTAMNAWEAAALLLEAGGSWVGGGGLPAVQDEPCKALYLNRALSVAANRLLGGAAG